MARVLAVDDSQSIRRMIALTLDDEGYEVTLAEDGSVALNLAKTKKFDLIITDLNMPNMGGIELIRQLRTLAEYKLTPILCLTTETSVAQKTKGRDAGATGWIEKPFSTEKLLKMMSRVL